MGTPFLFLQGQGSPPQLQVARYIGAPSWLLLSAWEALLGSNFSCLLS